MTESERRAPSPAVPAAALYFLPLTFGAHDLLRAWGYQMRREGDLMLLFVAAATLMGVMALVRRSSLRLSHWLLAVAVVVNLIASTIVVVRHAPAARAIEKVAFLLVGVLANLALIWGDRKLIREAARTRAHSTSPAPEGDSVQP
jgi:hypothetical protein